MQKIINWELSVVFDLSGGCIYTFTCWFIPIVFQFWCHFSWINIINVLIDLSDLTSLISSRRLIELPYLHLIRIAPVSYTHLDVYKRQIACVYKIFVMCSWRQIKFIVNFLVRQGTSNGLHIFTSWTIIISPFYVLLQTYNLYEMKLTLLRNNIPKVVITTEKRTIYVAKIRCKNYQW